MATIQFLETIDASSLLPVFSQAFSDYVIPMQLSVSQLEAKLHGDNVKPEYSVGIFEDGQLIGFILHGHDVVDGQQVLYNAGTGVIPEKRGMRLTEQMYSYALPFFREKGIDKILLEVIDSNARAVKVYERTGFTIVRELDCYNGTISATPKPNAEVSIVAAADWSRLQGFWNWKPTWQNSVNTAIRAEKSLVMLGIYQREQLCGYLIYNPQSKRVMQLAVSPTCRRQGLAHALFGYLKEQYGDRLSIVNVEQHQPATARFLSSIGLSCYIRQHEMALTL